MRGVNKVTLMGNLGSNPELRHTTNGTAVTQLSLATNESMPDGNGGWKDHTEWHRIVVFGKLAENCAKHLVKGRSLYVEGRLRTRSWENNDGKKQYSTEIVAREVNFLDRVDGGKVKEDPVNTEPPVPGTDEDIPF